MTIPAMTRDQSAAVIKCLAEVLPGHLSNDVGMGFDGVGYIDLAEPNVSWYFDSTWGGDDSKHEDGGDRLRVYVNVNSEYSGEVVELGGGLSLHDLEPDDAPTITDDPLEIARWIVDMIADGVPPDNDR